jgi:hypothetical protein
MTYYTAGFYNIRRDRQDGNESSQERKSKNIYSPEQASSGALHWDAPYGHGTIFSKLLHSHSKETFFQRHGATTTNVYPNFFLAPFAIPVGTHNAPIQSSITTDDVCKALADGARLSRRPHLIVPLVTIKP